MTMSRTHVQGEIKLRVRGNAGSKTYKYMTIEGAVNRLHRLGARQLHPDGYFLCENGDGDWVQVEGRTPPALLLQHLLLKLEDEKERLKPAQEQRSLVDDLRERAEEFNLRPLTERELLKMECLFKEVVDGCRKRATVGEYCFTFEREQASTTTERWAASRRICLEVVKLLQSEGLTTYVRQKEKTYSIVVEWLPLPT